MTPSRLPLAAAAIAGLAAASAPSIARADEPSIAEIPGDHPRYVFEAEPHLLFGYGGPYADGGDPGVGFRGTVNVANGFVKGINDSVGVGFGLDFGGDGHVLVPVVLQWNFWLSPHWSVFGEPGIAFGSGVHDDVVWPTLYLGGRFHFTDRIAMTLRMGYPDMSLGVSFLL